MMRRMAWAVPWWAWQSGTAGSRSRAAAVRALRWLRRRRPPADDERERAPQVRPHVLTWGA